MGLMRKSLSEQIYETLKADILDHKISFGEKLSNRELQQRFDVSSSPVRDAINHLALDGLLGDITNSGARVISFDLKFTLEINEIVMMLNCAAIKNAFRPEAYHNVKKELETLLLERENETDSEAYEQRHYQEDSKFHMLFISNSGNQQLQSLYQRYSVLWDMLVHQFYILTDDLSAAREHHLEIAASFVAGNLPQAIKIMEQHYSYAAELFAANMK